MSGFTNILLANSSSNVDVYWSSVIALLNFDGPDGQTTTVDSGPNAYTITVNNFELDTAIKKYGTAAGLLDATANNNCSIVAGASSDWIPNTAFTMEFDYYPNDVSRIACICGNRTGSDGWAIYQLVTGEINVQGYAATTGLFSITSSTNPTISTWQHVAVTRSTGGTWNMWLNGLNVGTDVESGVVGDTGSTAWIIGYDNSTAGRDLDANIDNFRATNAERYTAAFTPPTQAHPTEEVS